MLLPFSALFCVSVVHSFCLSSAIFGEYDNIFLQNFSLNSIVYIYLLVKFLLCLCFCFLFFMFICYQLW